MDPSDPKFQLLVGMMSRERQDAMRPRGTRPEWGCVVVAVILLVAVCLLVAGMLAR
jgi:hypothetical protein